MNTHPRTIEPASRQTALQIAVTRIGEATDAHRLRNQIRARTERRALANGFMAKDGYWPLMRWLSAGAERASGWTRRCDFLCLSEAVAYLSEQAARERRIIERRHWSANVNRLVAYRDLLVLARYFNRTGKFHWAQEAA